MTVFSRRLLGATALLALTVGSAQAADTIAIGVAGPMTGANAPFGEQLRKGAEKAVAEINAKGGVMGKQLTLEIGDDACDPKQAKAVSIDLAKKGVAFVAGHFCSSSSIPASETYAEEGILQITPASTNPKLTEDAAAKGWKTVFRTCGRDDQQGAFAGPWLAKQFAGKKVAVLHDKSAYGKGLADLTKENMNKAGLQEVAYEAITAGDKDFTALVTKLKDLKVDAIYLGGYHTELALIAKQSREQGLNAQLVSGDAQNTVEYAQLAGVAASNGTMFSNAAEARNLPSAKAMVDAFKKDGYDPEGYTLSTVAAIQVWAQAAEMTKSTDSAKVAEMMRAHSFDTVIGPVSFDEKGDLKNAKYVWYVYKDGAYSEGTNGF